MHTGLSGKPRNGGGRCLTDSARGAARTVSTERCGECQSSERIKAYKARVDSPSSFDPLGSGPWLSTVSD